MANPEFTIRVRVQGGTDVAAVQKALDGLGATVTRTNRQTSAAGKAADDFFDTQKKGIIGTANSTKSFSKLAETMGNSSSGVVGAYATLAANVFAVSAAFNALRGAAQVEQIFRGLEAAGTRTGLSLISTSNALKEVTGNAIDTEQAMRSTAQIVSAGFDSKTVERLGQAARDTSFALGRNMVDSLDRLSRGIVKLEPELLDELGIMTKLTESNVNYARTLGKSEAQLTAFEKRQGFANAVLAEAELKFGGLSAAAGDATVYDQLSAGFKDLTNEIFNYGNAVGKPLAKVLTADTTTLLGVMILFGSTLKNQLLPGLANSVAKSNAAAQAQRELARESLAAARASKDLAFEQQRQNLALKQNFDFIGTSGPAKYLQFRDSIKAGTASVKEQQQAINSLNSSIRLHQAQLASHPNYADTPATQAARTQKIQTITNLEQERNAVLALAAARANADQLDANGAKMVREARRAALTASLQARAQEQQAAALGAASQLKLGEAWKQLTASVRSYGMAQVSASSTGVTGMIRLQTAVFAAGAAVKALGAAFLAAIPYIGAAVFAFGLLKSAYEGLKSDATKNLEKAVEALSEVTGKANDYGRELVRINESQATAALRASAAITLQSNAIREANEKYEEFLTAFRNRNVSDSIWDLFGKETEDAVASWWQTLGTRGALSFSEGLKKNSQALNLAEALQSRGLFGEVSGQLDTATKQIVGQFKILEQTNKAALDRVVATRGGYETLINTFRGMSKTQAAEYMGKLSAEVNSLTTGNADGVKTFQESFKNLGNTLADFTRTNIPTTPYDELVKSFNSAESAMNELKKSLDPAQMSALLSGLDASTVRVLNVDTQADLEEYLKADALVQRIKALRKELEGRGERLDATQSRQLREAEAILANNQNLGRTISSEIEQRSQLVKQAQEQERLSKSQLSLLNAQIQSNSRIYQAGAAGMKARLDAEERSRKIQIQSLQTQIDVTNTLNGQIQLRIHDLEIRRQALEVGKQELQDARSQKLEWLEYMKERARYTLQQLNISEADAENQTRKGLRSVDRLPGRLRTEAQAVNSWRQIKDAMESIVDPQALIKQRDAEIKVIDGQILGLRNQSRDVLQQVAALQNQIKTIQEAGLDPAQRAAALANAQREYYAGIVNTLNTQAKSLGELSSIYAEIDARVAGVSDRLDFQMSQIRQRAILERTELQRTRQVELGQLRGNLATAQADLVREKRQGVAQDIAAAEAGVKFAQNALTVSENDYKITLQRIDAQERLNLIEKAGFDARTQGLEHQRQALDYVSKTIEAQRNLNDEEMSSYSIRQQLYAKRSGFEVSRMGENASEIESAKRAYDFALAEAGVRKSLIDLEYALLQSQRDNLVFELRARQSIYNQNDAQYKQIESVIDRVANINFDQAAATAKRAVDLAVRNRYDELQLARTGTTTDNPLFRGLSAVVGAIERNTALQNSVRAEPPAEIPQPRVVIDRSKAPELGNIAQSPQIRPNELLIKSIDTLRGTIEKWLQDNPLKSVDIATSEYGANFKGMADNVKTAIDFFLKKGLNAQQAAGIVGNLQQESGANLNPRADNGTHKGIAQWDATRQDRFFRMFGEKLEGAGIVKQLEYLWHEMKNDPYESRRLQNAGFWQENKTPSAYARSFETAFERSGGSALDKRMANAERLAQPMSVQTAVKLPTTPLEITPKIDPIKLNPVSLPVEPEIGEIPEFKPVSVRAVLDGELPLPEIYQIPASISIDAAEVSKTVTEAMNSATTAVPAIDQVRGALSALDAMTEGTKEALKDLGPQGEFLNAITGGVSLVANSVLNSMEIFQNSSKNIQERVKNGMSETQAQALDFADKFTGIASVASSALSTVQSALAASSQAKTDAIDREIAAEQKRDGKSAESVAKIQSLEKKKDEIAKKQFNTNKKLQMAQAVIATAAGVAQALAYGPIVGPILAGVIAAMGAAQIAIIAGTQYQSTASTVADAAQPASLSIGKRGDSVDLAKNNPNLGGEIGYIRGKQGTGSNASNYSVIGSAYGGDLPRGYGNTAYVVGEKGPETIIPEAPITVRPANDNSSASAPIDATINIRALDASGVAEVLTQQRGNIISMLREAANANGERFMEDVDVNVYTRPNVSRL